MPTACVEAPWAPSPDKVSLSDILLMFSLRLPTIAEMHGEGCHLPFSPKVFNYSRLLCPYPVFCWWLSKSHPICSFTADHIFPIAIVYAAVLQGQFTQKSGFPCFPGSRWLLHLWDRPCCCLQRASAYRARVYTTVCYVPLVIMAIVVLLGFHLIGIIIKGN